LAALLWAGLFFCGRKIRERKKACKKKRKRILKKILKKNKKREKRTSCLCDSWFNVEKVFR